MSKMLIFFAIVVSEMASDIYVPGLPYIQDFFCTGKSLVQLTLSLNLIGIAVSSLVYGVLSDCYGRRKILLLGFGIFTVASFLCCVAQNIYVLISMRFIQGFGAGVCGVVGHASIKDVCSGVIYAKTVSRLGMLVSLSPAIAPTIGGIILSRFEWHFIFVLVFVLAFAVLCLIFVFFEETLHSDNRVRFPRLNNLLNTYLVVLSNRTFLVMLAIQACAFMGLWNEIANLPFLFIDIMNVKVEYYGFFVMLSVFAYIIGTMINHKYVSRLGMDKMLCIGISMPILPEILQILISFFIAPNPLVIVLIWVPSTIGLALMITNSIAIALSSVARNAVARASACFTFTQMSFGAFAIYIVGVLFELKSVLPISITNIICSVIAMTIYGYGYRNKGL